jgi:peroxiredoxin
VENRVDVGNRFVDFSAPDMNGKMVRISDAINGKVALIDLWATWCGPCIVKSRTIVPVYEEFKEEGFVVVGVAGEFGSAEKLRRFLKKEQFPWPNLVEIDREFRTWEKYGIPKSGGGMFLVDRDGVVLAIDPTAEEVKAKLNELL